MLLHTLRRLPSRTSQCTRQWTLVQCRSYAQANDLAATLQQKHAWDAFPDDVQKLAVYAEHARANNYQIPLLSKATPDMDEAKAYHITAAIQALRNSTNGEVVAGRRVGFLNRKAWPQQVPAWSYMYQNTVINLPEQGSGLHEKVITANISHLSGLQPKVEPSILMGIHQPITSAMSDDELLRSIEWVANGLEVVISIFPGWKFTPVDATVGFALHGLTLVGHKWSLQSNIASSQDLTAAFARYQVELSKNGRKVDQSHEAHSSTAAIVALRQLVTLLAKDEHNAPIKAGEVISTGGLTQAWDIRNSDVWQSNVTGVDFPGAKVQFKL